VQREQQHSQLEQVLLERPLEQE